MDNPKTTFGTQDTRQTNIKHKTICVGRHYTQANTNKVNKTFMSPPTNNWR
jgi:hypothetical protein